MIKEELVQALFDATDVQAIERLIQENYELMDAEFFEIMRAETANDEDTLERFLFITQKHLDLSEGKDKEHLGLGVDILGAYEENRLDDFITSHKNKLTVDFTDTLIRSAEAGISETGFINIGLKLLNVSERLIRHFGYDILCPALYLNFSSYYLYIGDVKKAEQSIEKAFEYEALFDAAIPLKNALQINKGLTLFKRGKNVKASDFFEEIIPSIQDEYLRMSAVSNLAMAYIEIGSFSKALGLLNDLLEECMAKNLTYNLQKIYGLLANLNGNLGLKQEEEKHLLLSLECAKKQPFNKKNYDWHTLITTYLNLALYYLKQNDLEKSEGWLKTFKDNVEEVGMVSYLLPYLRTLAHLALKKGDKEKALRIVDDVLAEESVREDYEYLSFLGIAGIIKFRYEKYQEARDIFERLLALSRKTTHNEFMHVTYGYLGLSTFHLGDKEKAFKLFDETFKQDAYLRGNIDNRFDQFFFSADKEDLYYEIIKAAFYYADENTLFSYLQKAKSHAMHYHISQPCTIDKVKDVLSDDAVVLEYYHKKDLSFCLLVAKCWDKPVKVKLEIEEPEIFGCAQRFQLELAAARFYINKNPFLFMSSVAEKLLMPAYDLIERFKVLIVSPSSYANHLPFHIFPMKDGTLLLEKFAVSYTPNSTIFELCSSFELCSRKKTCHKTALVLGSSKEVDSEEARDLFSGETKGVENILLQSGIELLNIEGESFDNADSKAVFVKHLKADIVHLATHGEFDETDPFKSGFLLRGGGKELFFPIDEFNDYEIDSEFMFFSGCNTGKVKTVQNEELLGIMSVLLSGKTSSAILSFWPVLSLSDATKGIVEAFYKNWLQDKMPKTIALQEAMLLYRERANPYEWASYSLFGNCF